MVVDWGPHDVPVTLRRMWVVCVLGLLSTTEWNTHNLEPQKS